MGCSHRYGEEGQRRGMRMRLARRGREVREGGRRGEWSAIVGERRENMVGM